LEVDEVHQVSELSDEQSYAKTQLMVKPKESKVLGLKWDKQSDTLKISFPSEEVPATKRGILSKLAKIYDPLGQPRPRPSIFIFIFIFIFLIFSAFSQEKTGTR
jgi:hypothetical protein